MKRFLYFSLLFVSAYCDLFEDYKSYEANKKSITGDRRVDARIANYQAQVLVDGATICGGSIISEKFILTAAHCLQEKGTYEIIVGSLNLAEGKKLKVEELIPHEQYNEKTMENDIGLIKLHSDIEFDESQNKIRMSIMDEKPGREVRISGFGKDNVSANALSPYLKAAVVEVVPHYECTKVYKRANIEIIDGMFCASSEGVDSCQGDSGGPAVINGRLYGVGSFGIDCTAYPGVYTRVSRYIDWIKKNANF